MNKKTLLALIIMLVPMSAQAQSQVSEDHARRVASVCPGNWNSQECMKVVSGSTLVMVANYMKALDEAGKKTEVETIKQNCAAATAATQQEVPAYAMLSANTTCANMIYDVSEQTGVVPDQSHYQLLVGPILCMNADRRCPPIEQELAAKYDR